jgi:ubiquinone biosynthesis protein
VAGDREVGSFTEVGPWVVDPAAMPWRDGIDQVRAAAAARVPDMVRPRRLPPARSAVVMARLVGPSLGWVVRNPTSARRTEAADELAPLLRPAFERLGCTFIKLGQLIASGEGMIPPAWVNEFRSCHDRVKPESYDHVRGVVEEDLGRPLESVFMHFDPTPLAAASIAQVHAARLVTGEEVVVKVQRPGIDALVSSDIATLAWLAPLIEKRNAEAAIANFPAYIELFADTIVEELDFRLEAENMLDVARVLAMTEDRAIVVPRPHPELVTRRVLVMERLHGHQLDSEEALASAGIDPAPVFRSLIVSFLEGAMIHGVFHGDLHAGNMFVDDQGRPAIFDFGITGRLEEKKRQAVMGLMFSQMSRDGKALLRSFRDLGGFPADADLDELAAELRIEELIGMSPAALSPEDMALQMRDTTRALVTRGAKLPKELFLFVKGMVYLSGAVARVASSVDMAAEFAHLATFFAQNHEQHLRAAELDVEALKDGDQVVTTIRDQLGMAKEQSMTLKELQEAQRAQQLELRKAMKAR